MEWMNERFWRVFQYYCTQLYTRLNFIIHLGKFMRLPDECYLLSCSQQTSVIHTFSKAKENKNQSKAMMFKVVGNIAVEQQITHYTRYMCLNVLNDRQIW